MISIKRINNYVMLYTVCTSIIFSLFEYRLSKKSCGVCREFLTFKAY